VRYYGQWMRDEAEKRIGHLYPKVEVTAEVAKERPDLKPLGVCPSIAFRMRVSNNSVARGIRSSDVARFCDE
jgi:adenine-specific DNA methylase